MTDTTQGAPPDFYVGELTGADHRRTGTRVGIEPADLTTHGVIVGMTGSGKTGLAMVILEEALTRDIPVLVLDPKGDMGNLLLSFPGLRAEDFAPWVPAGSDPATVAGDWTRGLAEWGLGPGEVTALRTGHPMTVYTPGSAAGVPLDVIGSLTAPSGTDVEDLRDEAESLVQGLLGLVGVTSDPMSGREHVLIANIVESAWAAGETLDLASLLRRIQDPPMRKMGVIDTEAFFPRDDRMQLVVRLNGLLASPAFAAWNGGAALDMDSMLWDPSGAARAAVVHLAHLSEAERQLVVTRVAAALVTWMRRQPGSPTLRALLYMDEVFGFLPPSAAPPSKKPLLTLLKQARAYGLGVVLATQNPVDLDYKAISNAGTWMIGRLQTERDKARLMEGLTAADGSVDPPALDTTISGLAKREFLLHQVGRGAPRTFAVRWAMSYLAGPLAKDQLGVLPGMAEQRAATGAGATTESGRTTPTPGAQAGAAGAGGAAYADDEAPAMPPVPDGVPVRFVDPAAPWATTVGAVPGGRRLVAGVALRCTMLFDDTAADLHATDTWEAVLVPFDPTATLDAATSVDYDDRDLVAPQPPGTVFVVPPAPLDRAAQFSDLARAAKDWLARNRQMSIQVNRPLKLYGRPGETGEEFASRCRAEADLRADEEADKIRARLESRMDRLRDAIGTASLREQQARSEAELSRGSELISGAGSVLGALLGGRRSVRSITGAVNRAASGRSRTERAANRVEAAAARVEDKRADLSELEADLADALAEIQDRWATVADQVEEVGVTLEKTDVSVEQVTIIWVPTG